MLRQGTIDFEKESSAAMEQMEPEHKFQQGMQSKEADGWECSQNATRKVEQE